MPERMSYSAAIDFLYNLRLFGTKLGLENTLRLASLCGNPHEHLRFIHVAGTNGKGSTCAMLESIYRHAGLKVGLFTSPHLVSFTERIQVNRALISGANVGRITEQLIELLNAEATPRADQAGLGTPAQEDWLFRPTFFEFITVMALCYFREQRCDLVIWETGMGGRLDATNIVTPLASVITNIQLDHEKWLGNTLADIAAEKAGIIKTGVPVLTAAESAEALGVLSRKAAPAGAPFKIVRPDEPVQVSLFGLHQQTNAALALATVEALRHKIPVSEECIRRGLESVQWPGRFQQVPQPSGQMIILDGAHNPDGARVLRDALELKFAGEKCCFIFGVMQDKAWERICEILMPVASEFFFLPVHNERTADPLRIERFCRAQGWTVPLHSSHNFAEVLALAMSHRVTVVTGSLHFVGEAMQFLGISPGVSPKEAALNEWDASNSARSGAANLQSAHAVP